MKKIISFYFILLSTIVLLSPKTLAQLDLDVESGYIFSGTTMLESREMEVHYFPSLKNLKLIRRFSIESEYSIISANVIILVLFMHLCQSILTGN